MNHGWLLSPLVTISGLGNKEQNLKNSNEVQYELEELKISTDDLKSSSVRAKLTSYFEKLSVPPCPWDPVLAKSDRLNFNFTDCVKLYPRKRPTPLSPKQEECKEPIFSIEWLNKYTLHYPAVICLFCDLPDTDEEEDALIERLVSLRTQLASRGIFLMVVLAGEDELLREHIPYIRRQASLSPKNGLLAVPEGGSDEQLKDFVKFLHSTFIQLSNAFYSMKEKRIRERRQGVGPPMNIQLWDARYTIKLAYCAELKGDLVGATKLFESAYDTLSLLFHLKALPLDSDQYINGREALDSVALRIFEHSLPNPEAFDKFIVHLSIAEQNMVSYELDTQSKNALRWKAFQYAAFAFLCTDFKRYAPPSNSESLANYYWNQPAGCQTGLMWLDAAKLLVKTPENGKQDNYSFDGILNGFEDSTLMDPQQAFIRSISDLSGYPRAKAYSLTEYGKWLESTDPTAASQAFKSGGNSFPKKLWRDVQSFLDEKNDDQFALFMNGKLSNFPPAIKLSGDDCSNLFHVTGTFQSATTFVGRQSKAQITLTPQFPGELKLSWLKIVHSLGVVHLVSNEAESTRLVNAVDGEKSPLSFGNSHSCTFQIGITSLEIGDINLEEIQFQVADSDFTQSIQVERGENKWLTSSEVTPRTVKHLKRLEDPRKVIVNVRPAKMSITDNLLGTVATDERIKFIFTLTSNEEENITPDITVKVNKHGALDKNDDADDKKLLYHKNMKDSGEILKPSEQLLIEGEFTVPARIFEIVVCAKFETTHDSLPVMMEFTKEIDVLRPFRVSFDLIPEYLEQEWPAIFSPTLKIPEIARKWRLKPSILSMMRDTELILHKSFITVDCDLAEFEFYNKEVTIEKDMLYNSLYMVSHSFKCTRDTTDSSSPTGPLEAKAHLHLEWSRKSTPDVKNVFVLPPVRLNLPTHEPRVIASSEKLGGSLEMSQVTYHVENPTPRVLNFSISMSSSTYFAFQGLKTASLRILPFSTRALTYRLLPLGDAAVQNKRPLPELRVYDVNYKRTLAIQPGDSNITFDQGSLFI